MRSLLMSALPVILTLAAGCAAPAADGADEPAEEATGETASAITPIPIPEGYYGITPIPIPEGRPVHDAIVVTAAGIFYLSQRSTVFSTFYTAVHIGFDGKLLEESGAISGAVPKYTRNMVVSGGSLAFGDGTRTVVMPLDSTLKPSYHSLKACGTGAYDCGHVAADRTSGKTAIWQVGERTLRNVSVSTSYKWVTGVTSTCDLSTLGSGLTYSPSSIVTAAGDESSGRIHIAARLSDGRVVDCRGTVAGATPRVLPLPFKSGAGEVAFEGGGGIGFDGGGGIEFDGGGGIEFDGGGGIELGTGSLGFDPGGGLGVEGGGGINYVASSATPEIAVVRPDGANVSVRLTTAAAGTNAYSNAIPRHIRTTGTKAIVVTADRHLYLVAH